MKDAGKLILIIFGLCFLIAGGLLAAQIQMHPTVVPQNNTTTEPTPAPAPEPAAPEPEVETLTVEETFDELTAIPYVLDLGPTKSPEELYSLQQGDCDDKCVAFCQELWEMGYRDMSIVVASNPKVGYDHAYVLWNNEIYDLTEPTLCYAEDPDVYEEMLADMGYTSKITYKYYPGIWKT